MSVADLFANFFVQALLNDVAFPPIVAGAKYAHKHYLGNLSPDEVTNSILMHASRTDKSLRETKGKYRCVEDVPRKEAHRLQAEWQKYMRENTFCKTRMTRVQSQIQRGMYDQNTVIMTKHFENAQRCLNKGKALLMSNIEALKEVHPPPKSQIARQYMLSQSAKVRHLAYRNPMIAGVSIASILVVLSFLSAYHYRKKLTHLMNPTYVNYIID